MVSFFVGIKFFVVGRENVSKLSKLTTEKAKLKSLKTHKSTSLPPLSYLAIHRLQKVQRQPSQNTVAFRKV